MKQDDSVARTGSRSHEPPTHTDIDAQPQGNMHMGGVSAGLRTAGST